MLLTNKLCGAPKAHSFKYLGIFLDCMVKLNFNAHVDYLKSRLSQYCGITFRLRLYFNTKTAKPMYYACIFSLVTYWITVWGGALSCLSKGKDLQKLQHRIVFSLVHTLRLLLRFSVHSLKTLSVHTAPCSHLFSTVVCDIAMEEELLLTVLLASYLSKKKRNQRPTPLIFFTTVSLFTCLPISLYFSTNFSYTVLFLFLSQYSFDLTRQRQEKLWYN